jgi:uncharacterized membrane protein
VRVSFVVPTPSGELMGNLIGVLGLAAIVAAIGGLTGNWWWSVLAAGAIGVLLSYVSYAWAATQRPSEAVTPATATTGAEGPATAAVPPEPALRAAS